MPKKILVLLLVVFVPLRAAAQKKPLSLDQAVDIGLKNSPGLHASQMKLEAAAAKSKEVAAFRLPSLSFGGGYMRLSEVPPFQVTLPLPPPLPSTFVVSPNYFNNFSLRVSVQQPLFTGFRLKAGSDSARFLEQSAGHDLEKDRAEFVFSVKTSYWNLVRAREFERVVEENLTQIDEHLKDVKAFFDQGLLTKNEVLRVEVQRSNTEIMGIEARNGAEMALTLLNSLLGFPLDTEVEPTTPAESAAALPAEEKGAGEAATPQAMIQTALAGRPELKSAGLRVRASEAGVKAARAGWYPQVFLSGNYYYLRPNQRLLPTQDKFYGTWDLGVSLSFNVWNWGQTKSQSDQAKAQLAQSKDALKLLEDQAVLEVTQSRLTLVLAREKIRVSGQAVGQAEENLRVTRERFKQGLALNADVLDAEMALLQAKLVRTQAAIDLALAQARLQKALGD